MRQCQKGVSGAADGDAQLVVFPEPQICETTGLAIRLDRGVRIDVGERAPELELHAASLIERELGSGGGMTLVIGTPESNPRVATDILRRLDGVPNSDQGYILCVAADRITVAGVTSVGVLYGAQTLLQIIEREGGEVSVPECTIIDWPDRRYRGIFAESRWCSELMTLQDWKEAVDLLASLKFNVLSIGIANNWMIQYEGKRSEFFLVPIRKYPELRAPQSVEYYSARQGDYVRLEYLPLVFEQDFLGEVVAYGASRGITVYPHFNTPGHNTLIPHKIPEISSKDENGRSVGYGFCLSNPRTYEVMFDILDEIVDRHLLPNGVTWFHLGLDEVWPILGMDESEPSRVVSPFCRCDECASREWYDQFVDYVVALCRHLAGKGITKIGMWHDSFVRGGRMNADLAARFERQGLKDKVALHWWRYGGYFDTIHPELGIESWVVPMTGYYYWTPLSDHLPNIHLAARKGAEEHAAGAESYTVYYNAYFRNYACLAEYSWNPDAPGLDGFRSKYTRFLARDAQKGQEAFEHFEFVTGPMAPTSWAIYHYSYSYALNKHAAFVRANYPQAIVEQLWDNPGGVWHNLAMISQRARAARALFEQQSLWKRNPAGLMKAYCAEMGRTAATANLFLRLAQALRAHRDMEAENDIDLNRLRSSADELGSAIDEMDAAILSVETDLAAYMTPSMLRELTMQRRFAVRFLEEFRGIIGAVESGATALPALECMRTDDVRWVGKRHG